MAKRQSKTGGGKGTNQYKVRGVSKQEQEAAEREASASRNKRDAVASGVYGLLSEGGMYKKRGFRHKYDLGLPVEVKADWLDTEIGRVDFTEDLVLGFNDEPAATTKEEAWDMITEAADRYARLTAFVAAEQDLTCEELNQRVDNFGSLSDTPHPVEVREVVDIVRGEGKDPVFDKVMAHFQMQDGDEETLLRAAEGYVEYMTNKDLSEKFAGYTEHNLKAAIGMVSQLSGRGGSFSDDSHPLNPTEARVGADGLTAAQMLRKTVDDDALEQIRTKFQHSTDTPLVEECNGGLRINVTDTESLEIAAVEYWRPAGGDPYWNSGVRRVTTKSGKRVVTASSGWGAELHRKEALLAAADFTRPIAIGWEPGGRIGFKKRKQAQEG